MSSDDKRRKVARKLREYASWDDEEDCLVDCSDWGERVLNLLGCGDTEGECYTALADLIEPPTQCPYYHSDRHYCSVHEDLQVIDRDALLALADDIDKQTDGSMFDAWLEDGHYIARRIRGALGVVR